MRGPSVCALRLSAITHMGLPEMAPHWYLEEQSNQSLLTQRMMKVQFASSDGPFHRLVPIHISTVIVHVLPWEQK